MRLPSALVSLALVLLASLTSACIGPLAPYAPLVAPLLPEPDCTDTRTEVDASGRATEVPAPARCEVGVEIPLPGRRARSRN